MTVRSLFFFLGLLVIVSLLAACGITEPSPTLPPPPTPVTSDQPPPIVIELGTLPATAQETAVADSSPTPIQTPTLAPTATPTEEPEPVIDPAKMPAINQDLLFVGNGKLKRWQRDGNVVSLLDGDVVDYSLSKDGKQAVVAQLVASTEISNTVTAVTQTVNTYALNSVNLETGDTQRLVPAVNSFKDPAFQLSQDGRFVTFSGMGLGDAHALTLGEEVQNDLYVMEIGTGQSPKKIDACGAYCEGMVWHQDNNFFVFGSDDGLFLYNLAATKPELLLAGNGNLFTPLSWAKNGRWLLLRGEDMNGADYFVFDIPTKQLMIVPYTNASDGFPYADVTWMQDDRLFMVRNDSDTAVGETWRVNADANEVQRDESVILSEEHLRPWAPVHWANGRFSYGLLDMDKNTTSLYQRIAFNEPAELINSVPEAASNLGITWSPDGSGPIVHVDGTVYYVPTHGELVDLTTAVGLRGHNFTWLP
ncbi:MAG: hypothetical protein IAF02_00825 [Anaerolineae bacterium]|nr:hypothetical protein [Anaerolineae bacterium]